MNKIILKLTIILGLLVFSLGAEARFVEGIYLTQHTLENTSRLKTLIKQAKEVGISTFVIDIKSPNERYYENIQLVKASGLKYVARVVIFPHGGTREQVHSKSFWQSKYSLVEFAIEAGANEIQLDYIRYNTKQPASHKNAEDIKHIIDWYKSQVSKQGLPLQVDLFGETTRGPSLNIGQDIEVFAHSVNAICPMVYPSHYEPAERYYRRPYQTVYTAVDEIQSMFDDRPPFKIYAYIELSNYRYRMSRAQKLKYIDAQIQGAIDAKANGWYAWSAQNHYDNLFTVLKERKANPHAKHEYNEAPLEINDNGSRAAQSSRASHQGRVVHMY